MCVWFFPRSAVIGSRCKGECSECATQLQCPRRQHRRHQHGRRESGRMRRHFESNVTAPDCTCTLPDSPWALKMRNSSCGQKFLERRKICGSDGVTYANKCEFKNNQSKNAALGKRCHGACPCDFEREGNSSNNIYSFLKEANGHEKTFFLM